MNRRGILAAAGLIGIAGCTTARGEVVTEVFEATFEPAAVDSVNVTNEIGNVTVRADETETVSVRIVQRSTNGQSGLDDITATAEERGGTVTVQAEIADDANWFSRSSPSTDVTVTVPTETTPEITEIDSQLGDVTLIETRGDTRVRTQLGRVIARGVDGYPSLRSELGDVFARGTTGLGDVSTQLGDVDLALLDVRDRIEIRTELGEVSIRVGPNAAFDLVAESNGDIVSDLSLSNVQTGSGRLAGQYNDGGPRVRVVTELGDIRLTTT